MLARLLEAKSLGQKTRAGFYKKVGRDILRLDPESMEYVPGGAKADEVVGRMLKKPAGERLKLLRNAEGAEPRFLWAILRDQFHYAAVHLASIADTARDVDLAMRWGFGVKQGPFELWQEAGWLQVANWIKEDIDAGKALSKAPLPDWVFNGPVAEAGGVHTPEGSWSASSQKFIARRKLPVYERQHFPEDVLGAKAPAFETAGTTLHEDDAIRLWTLDGANGEGRRADRQHQDQDARHQPRRGRRPGAGRGPGREKLQGPGDLVERRDVLGRRRPAGHAAGLHDGRRVGRSKAPRPRCRT